jgi:hypothetical protein
MSNQLKVSHHIAALQDRHRKLDEQISMMERNNSFDDVDISYLKKQRLLLKDEIEKFVKQDQET